MRKNVSIVIPVYNEARNIVAMTAALQSVFANLEHIDWSIIWVNDGSSDDSWSQLSTLIDNTNACGAIRHSALDLSRNFGKEIALTAGLAECTGADAVICLDADLQHPPALIPILLDKWMSGAEIVATIRESTEDEPVLRKIASRAYYWLMSKISGLNMRSQTTDFRLYDKKVVDAFLRATERQRMVRGIMDWLGFKKEYVSFHAAKRQGGAPGYSYKKLWALAINSITSFSLFPLKVTGYLGVLITLGSFLLLSWMLFFRFFVDKGMYSPLSIVVVINTLLIGIVLMAIGMVALYIGSIHTEVINRPLYVVRERVG